jgi:poly(3-hydroxyoctanoate) depolymerase
VTARHERFMQIAGPRLRVSTAAGNARPLLLLGGVGANGEMWRPLRRVLSGASTIGFDAAGTGRSKTPRWPLRSAQAGGAGRSNRAVRA